MLYGTNRELFSLAAPAATGLRLAGVQDVRIDAESTDQWFIAVNGGGHVSRYVLAFTEFLYNDLGESRLSGVVSRFSPRVSVTMRPRVFEWTGGIRAQVPTGTWRIRPYAGVGAGTVWLKVDAEGPSQVSVSTRDFTYHFDVGLGLFIAQSFGLAPEFRVVHIPDDSFYRLSIGAVFRFE